MIKRRWVTTCFCCFYLNVKSRRHRFIIIIIIINRCGQLAQLDLESKLVTTLFVCRPASQPASQPCCWTRGGDSSLTLDRHQHFSTRPMVTLLHILPNIIYLTSSLWLAHLFQKIFHFFSSFLFLFFWSLVWTTGHLFEIKLHLN